MSPSQERGASQVNTHELMTLLRERYPKAEYAFFTEVANGTGSHANRHADALAMSLWPSRGLYLTGFELKVSRTDWLKELKNPAKADSIARYCDYWFLVVSSEDIVQPGELPQTWGLLSPSAGKLKVKVQASKLEPQPLSVPFIAALFRSAQAQITKEAELERVRTQEYRRGYEEGHKSRSYEVDRLRLTIEKFEREAGVSLDEWRIGSIVEAMKLVETGLVADSKRTLAAIRAQAARVIEAIDRTEANDERKTDSVSG
jgi:hypothetical protein